MVIPRACRDLVPGVETQPAFWDRWMSLAACMQDGAIGDVSDRSQIEPLITSQIVAVAPSMLLYGEALQRAPKTVQFRAAYHVGLASVALITRARRSISATVGAGKLRDELEWRLEPVKQMARAAFGAVLDGAQLEPAVAADPVGRYMVRSARMMLPALSETRADQRVAQANE